MNGKIAVLINSSLEADKETVNLVFGPRFRSLADWRGFLRVNLNGSVRSLLAAPEPRWSVKSFHALYIACWVHHPVEKGSFMIDLGHLSAQQRDVICSAMKKYCSSRRSSHLGKHGYSASQGWNFLNNYHELLLQYEETLGHPYLFLKAEGHTTGITGVVPHLLSWVHKKVTGEGKEVSPKLNELAKSNPLLARRAAENFAKGYEALLEDVLKLSGTKVMVHQALEKLFSITGFRARTNVSITAPNAELGEALQQYCEFATNPGPMKVTYTLDGKITPKMIEDLKAIAQALKADSDSKFVPRVFLEVRATPVEIDGSIDAFCNYDVAA